ncbi:MAG: hypothetical protein JRN15_21705 [Nitrososphaerota archaeon]|nr:hypothetical protein [Nitrososphaerota archaeon]
MYVKDTDSNKYILKGKTVSNVKAGKHAIIDSVTSIPPIKLKQTKGSIFRDSERIVNKAIKARPREYQIGMQEGDTIYYSSPTKVPESNYAHRNKHRKSKKHDLRLGDKINGDLWRALKEHLGVKHVETDKGRIMAGGKKLALGRDIKFIVRWR